MEGELLCTSLEIAQTTLKECTVYMYTNKYNLGKTIYTSSSRVILFSSNYL